MLFCIFIEFLFFCFCQLLEFSFNFAKTEFDTCSTSFKTSRHFLTFINFEFFEILFGKVAIPLLLSRLTLSSAISPLHSEIWLRHLVFQMLLNAFSPCSCIRPYPMINNIITQILFTFIVNIKQILWNIQYNRQESIICPFLMDKQRQYKS